MGGNYEELVSDLLSEVSGYTDMKLGLKLGVSTAMVSRWRNGKGIPNETNLENIRRLGLSLKLVKVDNESVSEIKQMITDLGGVTSTSKVVGKSIQLIYQWRWGKCKPSPIDCKRMKLEIEKRSK